MGEVWRADDLILDTPVALKVIFSTDREGRARILNEVRLARQITHPAVCRVFDVGESAGEIFYTMELVHGEDLATLVRRLGRLPAEKVIDIGRQLCDGLAAAHAQGALHRDLRPANVLIDEDGLVRITDFGIAVPRDETEKTDIYALGLILYELLVGRQALDGRANPDWQPAKPSTLISEVDPHLERAILKAIAPDSTDRPASAHEMSHLLVSPSRSRPRMRAWAAGAALAGTVAAIVIGSSFFLPSAAPRLTSQDTIVLADFMNTTGEPVFDGALKVALAVALEQSPFLKIFPDERVRETLRLMQRPPDERVTRSVAREIARREQLKALVAGSIGTLGQPLRARARGDQRGDGRCHGPRAGRRCRRRSRC